MKPSCVERNADGEIVDPARAMSTLASYMADVKEQAAELEREVRELIERGR